MHFSDCLAQVQARIQAACAAYSKDPARMHLLAVSKTFPLSAVEEAIEAGVDAFGENYVQEGVEKIQALAARHTAEMGTLATTPANSPTVGLPNVPASPGPTAIVWHFIGPLQSNKSREVAEHFDWMHSIDREKIAQRLSDQRPPSLHPLQVCIQVNVSGEASKSGVAPEAAAALAMTIAKLPRLVLRGLMAIPEPTEDKALQRMRFRALATLFQNIRETLPAASQKAFDTLSMGMSADLEAAVAESLPNVTTMIRVGTALFGQRSSQESLP